MVFAGGIDVAKTETKDTILIHNAEELMNYSKSEEKAIEEVTPLFDSIPLIPFVHLSCPSILP